MGLRAHEATASEALRALSSQSEEQKSKEVEKSGEIGKNTTLTEYFTSRTTY